MRSTASSVGAASSITLSLNYPYSSTHPKPTSSLRSLSLSSTTSHNVFSTGLISMSPVVRPTRHSIICEAAPNKKADSAAKRARQAEKRRVYNKAQKSEVKTRMKKLTMAEYIPGRTDVQCLHRWQKVLNPELVKGPWTKEEDDCIIGLVEKYGCKKWSAIAKFLPGRIGKPIGLISLLDEDSNFLKATDLTFANKFKQHLSRNPCFKGERGGAFGICHYAGEVFGVFRKKGTKLYEASLKDEKPLDQWLHC
ncbi:unnamed protein product [Camellia sinensis]